MKNFETEFAVKHSESIRKEQERRAEIERNRREEEERKVRDREDRRRRKEEEERVRREQEEAEKAAAAALVQPEAVPPAAGP